MSDLIDRQGAINAVLIHGTELERRGITVLSVANHKQVVADLLEQLPSAQPEIVRCKDCRYAQQFKFRKTESWIIECNNNEGLYRDVPEDGYCYCGERREE